MGASRLTGIITCQIQKEYPDHTLSDFIFDSHVVHPVGAVFLTGFSPPCYREELLWAPCNY